MGHTKIYISNASGVQYLENLNKRSKFYLFFFIPTYLLISCGIYFYASDNIVRIAGFLIILLFVFGMIYIEMIKRGKFINKFVRKITFSDNILLFETFESVLFKSKQVNLSLLKLDVEINDALFANIGEVCILKNGKINYLLVKLFFDEYDSILSALQARSPNLQGGTP